MSDSGQVPWAQEPDGQPVYNIKAVVEATGLPAATLRAWERRYGALNPSRTASGYRLYSSRDIATLVWLKDRMSEGLSISQAISLLANRARPGPALAGEKRSELGRGSAETRAALLDSLLHFDEVRAERLLSEAFTVLGLEMASEHIVAPVMTMLGDLWHEGKTSTAAEHFATNYLRRKLDAIINAAPPPAAGPVIVLGCAPGDWHELGMLLLHLMLRRRGLNTLYLGQNVPVAQFVEAMARLRPAMVIMAAATAETVPGLVQLSDALAAMPGTRPLFAFGGRIFNVQPELRSAVAGIHLGENIRTATSYIMELLAIP